MDISISTIWFPLLVFAATLALAEGWMIASLARALDAAGRITQAAHQEMLMWKHAAEHWQNELRQAGQLPPREWHMPASNSRPLARRLHTGEK